MLKVIPYFLLMLLLTPTIALANVNVEISNNLDSSNNNVNVNSNTGGNNGSSDTVSNQTDIKINNNGEVKEYHGSDGKIEIKSSDGKSSVSVNTTGASNNSSHSSSSVNSTTNITVNSNTASSSASPEASVAGAFKESVIKDEAGFWDFIKKEFASLFKMFH